MRLLSLDLELNQPSQKIIQVGACVFKSKTGEIIDRLRIFVNPKEQLDPRIIDLTKITQDMVDSGTTVLDAYKKVCELREKHKCPRGIIVWGSGEYNDSFHLWKESGDKEPNDLGRRVTDAKALYQSLQMYNNGTIKSGLEASMKKLGLKFEGQEHDALCDAVNTAKIWHFLAAKLSRG